MGGVVRGMATNNADGQLALQPHRVVVLRTSNHPKYFAKPLGRMGCAFKVVYQLFKYYPSHEDERPCHVYTGQVMSILLLPVAAYMIN